MVESYPSRGVLIADVPEPQQFQAQFVYNFYVPDERVNATAGIPAKVLDKPAESFDAKNFDDIRRKVPRYVKLTWRPPTLPRSVLEGNEFLSTPSGAEQKINIAENLNFIQREEELSNFNFSAFEFQDNNIDQKLFTLVSGSIAKRIASRNRETQIQIDDRRQLVFDNLTTEHSLLDASKALAEQTSEGVLNNVIVDALNDIRQLNATLIDEDGQQEIIIDKFNSVKQVKLKAQFSRGIAGKIIQNIIDDPMSPYADELFVIRDQIIADQQTYLSTLRPDRIDLSGFEFQLTPVETTATTNTSTETQARVLGYIIEKHELTQDGNLIRQSPIIIESSTKSIAFDFKVAYGRTYIYTIRTVAELSGQAAAINVQTLVNFKSLISSQRSPRATVNAVENVPPPPPADFNIFWDYQKSKPRITWCMPVNSQRDVKKIQVFRRKSILDPFQLIKEFDFDDSTLKYSNPETPDPRLVEKRNAPTTFFVDDEFQTDSKYIYAGATVDAHQLSSNLSVQFEVTYNQFLNRIQKTYISDEGAPKSYPNLKLQQDLFVDTIKDSNHDRLKIYFDPEYYNVFRGPGEDLKLLQTDRTNGKYRLQIMNVDLAEQEVVDIIIEDRRSAAQESEDREQRRASGVTKSNSTRDFKVINSS